MSDSLDSSIRDSAPDDLRALGDAAIRGHASPRISAAEIYVAPSFHGGGLPIVSFDASPPRARWVTRVAVLVATLAVSMAALAAVPTMIARPPEDAREVVRSIAAQPRRASPEIIAPPEALPTAGQIAPVVPSPTTEPLAAAAPRVARRSIPPAPSHTAVTPPPVRFGRRAPVDAVSGAPAGAAIDPTLALAVDSALAGARGAVTSETLPATPLARDVSLALRALEREVAQCRETDGGTIATRIVIEGATGRVQRVGVSGADGGEGACVARVVETVRFPRFAQEQFVVTFPYRI